MDDFTTPFVCLTIGVILIIAVVAIVEVLTNDKKETIVCPCAPPCAPECGYCGGQNGLVQIMGGCPEGD